MKTVGAGACSQRASRSYRGGVSSIRAPPWVDVVSIASPHAGRQSVFTRIASLAKREQGGLLATQLTAGAQATVQRTGDGTSPMGGVTTVQEQRMTPASPRRPEEASFFVAAKADRARIAWDQARVSGRSAPGRHRLDPPVGRYGQSAELSHSPSCRP